MIPHEYIQDEIIRMDILLDIVDTIEDTEQKEGIVENIKKIARELRTYKCEYPDQYKSVSFEIYGEKENAVEKMIDDVD